MIDANINFYTDKTLGGKNNCYFGQAFKVFAMYEKKYSFH